MQASLDGFIEGPNGDMDWLAYDDEESWASIFQLLKSVDTVLAGSVMYPGYEKYWRETLTNPSAPKNEIEYARFADKTQHIVFSNTLEKTDPIAIGWKNTKIVKGNIADEVAQLKKQAGMNMVIFGGASLVSSFIRLGLIDEYHLLINPVTLGGGKSPFKEKHKLKLVDSKTYKSGLVELHYLPTKE
jgi:dihydrofolate reductase